MPVFLDFLYREYCRARLAEMRQQLLIQAERHEVSEPTSDANQYDRTGNISDQPHEASQGSPN